MSGNAGESKLAALKKKVEEFNRRLLEKYGGKVSNAPGFTAILLMGLPAAGKTTLTRKRYGADPAYIIIDPDAIAETLPGYDPKDPQTVHAKASELAEAEWQKALTSKDKNVIFDGTGTKSEKLIRRMKEARAAGFRIKLLYVVVPLEVSIERNKLRDRTVPDWVIKEKADQIQSTFDAVRVHADDIEVKDNTVLTNPPRIDITKFDDFEERRIKEMVTRGVPLDTAIRTYINGVEGDWSQLSDEMQKAAKKLGIKHETWDYEADQIYESPWPPKGNPKKQSIHKWWSTLDHMQIRKVLIAGGLPEDQAARLDWMSWRELSSHGRAAARIGRWKTSRRNPPDKGTWAVSPRGKKAHYYPTGERARIPDEGAKAACGNKMHRGVGAGSYEFPPERLRCPDCFEHFLGGLDNNPQMEIAKTGSWIRERITDPRTGEPTVQARMHHKDLTEKLEGAGRGQRGFYDRKSFRTVPSKRHMILLAKPKRGGAQEVQAILHPPDELEMLTKRYGKVRRNQGPLSLLTMLPAAVKASDQLGLPTSPMSRKVAGIIEGEGPKAVTVANSPESEARQAARNPAVAQELGYLPIERKCPECQRPVLYKGRANVGNRRGVLTYECRPCKKVFTPTEEG